MTAVVSIDPRTGQSVEEVAEATTPEQVDAIARQAAAAATSLEGQGRAFRARLLRALADALEADREAVVSLADRETALGTTRLNGELTRSAYQLRLFAEVVEDGGFLEAIIDHAGDTPMGPRPDLRRMLVPIGPVGVFGASNFPLAFSVPGGDTASALAAGCPVIVKAHSSHAATSQRVFEALAAAADQVGAPEGTLSIVYGHDAGTALVQHPLVRAVGFTGSLSGGRALADLAAARPDPIPFYGELSSLNPIVVTRSAAAERAEDFAKGLVGSFTLGAGQFCTKPGLVFVPASADGDRLRQAVTRTVAALDPQIGLNAGIQRNYRSRTGELAENPKLARVTEVADGSGDGFWLRPAVFSTSTDLLDGTITDECFGPTTVLVSYQDERDLLPALRRLPGSLTASVHAVDNDPDTAALVNVLRDKAGRLLFNGYPTGVAVAWAQQHGGPWPSTNTLHTSVGMTSVRRFQRPLAWQSAPESVLPAELRDGDVDIPRRVDGVLVLPPK